MSALQDKIAAERKRRERKSYEDAITNVSGVRDIGTSLTQMPTLGWGDEITSAVAAGGAKLTGDKRPYGEVYNDILSAEQGRMSKFREEHPGDALGAEVVGGLATGGLGLARTLGKKAAGKLASTGVIGAESAAYGAGSSNPGERGEGALWGTGLGLGTAGVLKLAGTAAKYGSKRNIAQDLGSGENFVPLNVADQGWRGEYGDFLGRTYGGGPMIREQTERLAQRATAQAQRQEEKLNAMPERFQQEKQNIRDQLQQEQARRATERKAGIDTARLKANEIVESAPHVAPQQIPAPTFEQTRRKMASDSLPETAGELRNTVQELPALQARDEIAKWWGTNGFAEIKGRTFAGPKELIIRLNKMMKQSPELVIELGNVARQVKAMANAIGKGKTVEIDGNSLMAMRNVFARGANEKVADKFGKKMLRDVANEFDNSINNQLDDAGKEYFAGQKEAYKRNVIFQSAVKSSFARNAGEFSPAQVLTSEQRVVGTTAKTPYGPESRAMQEAEKQAKAQQEAANEAAKAQQRAIDQTSRKEAASVLREARAAREAQAQKDATVLRQTERKAKYNLKENATTQEAKEALRRSKEKAAAVAALAPPAKQATLSRIFTTSLVGGVPLGLVGLATGAPGLGLAAGVLAGSKIAKGLASEGGQKFVAGQTQWQEAMAKALRERKKELERYYRTGYRASADQQE